MNDGEFDDYIKERYEKYLKYYDKRATHNKFWNDACSIYILLISVAIAPILTIDLLFKGSGVVWAMVLSPTVALVAGIKTHKRFYENWLNYRRTWDNLQHEHYWKKASANVYKDAKDKNVLFVERVENLIAEEGSSWMACHKDKESKNS